MDFSSRCESIHDFERIFRWDQHQPRSGLPRHEDCTEVVDHLDNSLGPGLSRVYRSEVLGSWSDYLTIFAIISPNCFQPGVSNNHEGTCTGFGVDALLRQPAREVS